MLYNWMSSTLIKSVDIITFNIITFLNWDIEL